MTTAGRQGDAARAAFHRAVQRERDAIRRHEMAARQQDAIADAFEQHALHDRDDLRRDRALDNAASARGRAEHARARAAEARQRLHAEGEDPDGDRLDPSQPAY